ncbi:hypothetical protein ACFRDV_23625 [Streptomyces fagopyri]
MSTTWSRRRFEPVTLVVGLDRLVMYTIQYNHRVALVHTDDVT